MTTSFSVQRNFSLRSLNSFAINVSTAFYKQVTSVENLFHLSKDKELSKLPRLVLGGGSNLLFMRDYPGLVLHMQMRGIEVVDKDNDATYVRAAAGEPWHDFVLWTLSQNLRGLENLSLIPGTVGAAPVQNIGAYGVELRDCFHSLRAYDFNAGEIKTYTLKECRFAYRDSIFKQELANRMAILDVTFALPKKWSPNFSYAEVEKECRARGLTVPTARDISNVVISIRQRKLPDPAQVGNAGSFFKNPVVDREIFHTLRQQHPGLPGYIQSDGRYRIAAGWLIDQCGWKGKKMGNAGVYETQALVLVNRDGATGQEIMKLANAIKADVEDKYGLSLEIEPVVI